MYVYRGFTVRPTYTINYSLHTWASAPKDQGAHPSRFLGVSNNIYTCALPDSKNPNHSNIKLSQCEIAKCIYTELCACIHVLPTMYEYVSSMYSTCTHCMYCI